MEEPTIGEVAEATAEVTPPQETIGDVLKSKEEVKVVPEAAFLELKNQNKEMKRELKQLRTAAEDGATPREVSADIEALAEEYDGVDKKFLAKLAATIKAGSKAEMEAILADKLKPYESERAQKQIDTVFDTHYTKAMAEMPEYGDVANRDVIKALSMLPQNASKTFSQLIEDTYGSAVRGTRTIETTSPRGGTSPDTLDLDRAGKDSSYLNEVFKTPQLKKQWDAHVMEQVRRG